jgi:hypothetical protein
MVAYYFNPFSRASSIIAVIPACNITTICSVDKCKLQIYSPISLLITISKSDIVFSLRNIVVTPVGFEPYTIALKGQYPKPLDEGANQ